MSDFSLPEGWKVSKLADLAGIYSGGTPDRGNPDFWNGDIPWATPTDITHNGSRTISKTTDKITKKGLGSSSAKLLPPGSVLMTSRATLGESKISTVEICTNQGFKSLVPLKDVDSWFLFYQLQLNKERYAGLGIGSTFLEVNMKDTASFEVPCAPFNEQRKIAKILTTVDNLIEKTEALIAKYEAIKQGMMHDLFTRGVDENGRLRPSYQEAPGLYQWAGSNWVPKFWEVKSFTELIHNGIVAEILDGNHGEMHPKSDDFVESGIPFIMANDIKNHEIDTENCHFISEKQYESLRVGFSRPKDVLLTHKGTIGLTAIVPEAAENIMLTPQVTYYRIQNREKLFHKYLYFYFQSGVYQSKLQSLSEQTTRKYIGITEQKKLYCYLPNIEEQKEIANILEKSISTINSEYNQLKKLKRVKTALMQDLLTGKVRVTPDEETEAHV